MAEQYTYAAARIHAIEASLLSLNDLEQVLSAESESEAVQILAGKGFDGLGAYKSIERLLADEEEKTAKLMCELIPDTAVLRLFSYADDFNNLKAAVKSLFSGRRDGLFVKDGDAFTEKIKTAVLEKNYSELPENMREAAEAATEALAKTGDGQLADIIIDRTCLEAVYKTGLASDSEVVREYAELFVALADLKIAVRGCRIGKSESFLNRAMAECETLDIKRLCKAAAKDEEKLFEYIAFTPYADSIAVIKKSYTQLEKWCDDKIMELFKLQKSKPFTIAPVVAYYYARQTELKAVRMILSCVVNKLDREMIKERLRNLYV